jgi:hypothetical protein
MPSTMFKMTCAFALLGLLVGCGQQHEAPQDAGPSDAGADAPVLALDLLIVFDTAPYEFECNGPWGADFHVLTERLRALGVPVSLHIGIINANLPAGEFEPIGCPLGGDEGALQNNLALECTGPAAEPGALVDPADRFLRWTHSETGDDANFTGDVSSAIGCYAGGLAMSSCGLVSIFGSVRGALEGCEVPGGCTQALNEGFLRSEAALAVVVMSQEDDCSLPADSLLFDSSDAGVRLGPYGSRCLEYGILCGGQPVGYDGGPRSDCAPGNADPDPRYQLVQVADVVSFLQGFKDDPSRVYVAVIGGPPAPVSIDANVYPSPAPTCTGTGPGTCYFEALPGIRLAALVGALGSPGGRFLNLCSGSGGLKPQLDQIGADLAALLTNPATHP